MVINNSEHHIEARTNRTLIAVAVVVTASLVTGVLSLFGIWSGNRSTEAIRELQAAGACRAEIAGADDTARSRVIRIIAEALATAPEDSSERIELYQVQLPPAIIEMDEATTRRDRINDICKENL